MDEMNHSSGGDQIKFKLPEEFRALSHAILTCANRGEPKIDFVREVSELILNFSGCDDIRIVFKDNGKYSCSSAQAHGKSAEFKMEPYSPGEFDDIIAKSAIDIISHHVWERRFDPSLPFFTPYGSFWTGDTGKPLTFGQAITGYSDLYGLEFEGEYRSVAIIPITIISENVGLLHLFSEACGFFTIFDLQHYETVAQGLGIALINHRAQAALRERVKELTCLYGIATLSKKPDITKEKILQGIVNILPPAWQYPEITCGEIVVDGDRYRSPEFAPGVSNQAARIVVDGQERGTVEVNYTKPMPELDEGPFLKEERNLIDAVALQIALIMEQKQAEEERQMLQEQLRHADRLATIGQLAAGVAHELNEPLGSILGFAQLARKGNAISKQTDDDVQKIINAALHAREVVRKLMLFSRQMPTRQEAVDLNKTITEGLYFLESRCAKAGIEMIRRPGPNIPLLTADQSQIYQVLVNLAVNAVQAMPEGGKLTITTALDKNDILLIVEDTGMGMSKEVMGKLFIPFFSTKDINEGTGLGLSVVHGIVTSHGGAISVESEVGRGSRFTIRLPLADEKGRGLQNGS